MYNTFIQIITHSDAITYYTKALLDGEYNQYNVFKFRSNYVLQDIQQLNSSTVNFDDSTCRDIDKFTNIYSTIDINDLEERTNLILSEDQIKSIEEINNIFTEISNIIDKNIKYLEKDSWNNPNILKDDIGIKMIKDINGK